MHRADGEGSFRNHAGDGSESVEAEVLEGLEVGLGTGTSGAVGSGNGKCGGDRSLHAHD
jgi:hypothetical protein